MACESPKLLRIGTIGKTVKADLPWKPLVTAIRTFSFGYESKKNVAGVTTTEGFLVRDVDVDVT